MRRGGFTRCLSIAVIVAAFAAFIASIAPSHANTQANVVGTGTAISCNEQALRLAIAAGGEVSFNCGGATTITLTAQIDVTKDVAVHGAGNISLSGGLSTRIFAVQPNVALTLTNVVLTQALTLSSNGGALANKGHLYLDGVTFAFNSINPEWNGAAIYTTGPATILNSRFLNNDAGSAGAIYASSPAAKLVIAQSQFSNNSGLNTNTGLGGAMWIDQGADVRISDSSFAGNRANFGGAVYVAPNSRLQIRASSFINAITDNIARGSGGAIYNEGNTGIIGVLFRSNKTPTDGSLSNYGGAIASTGQLTITESFFRENESRFGGGVFAGSVDGLGSTTVDHSGFSKNRAVVFGGGLYTNITTNTVVINQSSFNANVAQQGGGIARVNANLTISNTSLTNNTAAIGGGGLYITALPDQTAGGYVRVRNATIAFNSSTDERGGGVYNFGRVELYYTTIVSNTQGVYRGNSGNTRLRNSLLQNPNHLNCDGDGNNSISNDSANLSTDSSCDTIVGNPTLDPMLGPVQVDSWQPTWYFTPLPGSPLIDQGNSCPTHDQRGALRKGGCDIGAVEFGGLVPQVQLPTLMR